MSENDIRSLATRLLGKFFTEKTRVLRVTNRVVVYYRAVGGHENKRCELRLFRHEGTGSEIAMEYAPEIDTIFWDDFS